MIQTQGETTLADQLGDKPLETTTGVASTDATTGSATALSKSRRLHAWMLFIVGIVAGTAVWMVAPGLAKEVGALPEELRAQTIGSQYNQPLFLEIKAAERRGAGKGAMLVFGMFGAAVGASLATVKGMQSRSLSGSLVGFAAGFVLGAGMGVLMGILALEIQDWLINTLPLSVAAYRPVLVHVAVWGGVGLGIGVAAGLSMLSLKAALRGMVIVGAAGVGAAFVYTVASAVLVPMNNADQVLPSGDLNQWVWISLASGFMGLAVAAIHQDAVSANVSKAAT